MAAIDLDRLNQLASSAQRWWVVWSLAGADELWAAQALGLGLLEQDKQISLIGQQSEAVKPEVPILSHVPPASVRLTFPWSDNRPVTVEQVRTQAGYQVEFVFPQSANLPSLEQFQLSWRHRPDLVLFLGQTGLQKLDDLGLQPVWQDTQIAKLLIDFQASQQQWRVWEYIYTEAKSYAEVVYWLFKQLNWSITASMADWILAGIDHQTDNLSEVDLRVSSLQAVIGCLQAGGKRGRRREIEQSHSASARQVSANLQSVRTKTETTPTVGQLVEPLPVWLNWQLPAQTAASAKSSQ